MKTLEEMKAEVEKIEGQTWGWIFVDNKREWVEKVAHPTVFIINNALRVSSEDGCIFCDWYGEYRGNMPWIHPKLEEWAKANGGIWEWNDPGSIDFCQ